MSSEQIVRPRGRVLRGAAAGVLRSAVIDADLTILRPAPADAPSTVSTVEELEVIQRQARDEAARMGYEDGFAAGQRDALAQARTQAEDATQAVQQALAALDAAAARLRSEQSVTVADVEQHVVTMALSIAEAVLGREVAAAAAPARDALVRALALAPRGVAAVARLHPADARTIGDVAALAADRTISIVADPSVEAGGCVLDAGPCRIDAQVGPALDRVREALGA